MATIALIFLSKMLMGNITLRNGLVVDLAKERGLVNRIVLLLISVVDFQLISSIETIDKAIERVVSHKNVASMGEIGILLKVLPSHV